jgi:hypothetical protein
VHVGQSDISDETLEAIGHVLQEQEYVFTTSYDLIVYWAMGAVGYDSLCDCFWGEKHAFDPAKSDPATGQTPVYFLHGALHLVVMGSGVTRKLVHTGLRTLLAQFGRPVDGDAQARPLLITEGSSQHKVRTPSASSANATFHWWFSAAILASRTSISSRRSIATRTGRSPCRCGRKGRARAKYVRRRRQCEALFRQIYSSFLTPRHTRLGWRSHRGRESDSRP